MSDLPNLPSDMLEPANQLKWARWYLESGTGAVNPRPESLWLSLMHIVVCLEQMTKSGDVEC